METGGRRLVASPTDLPYVLDNSVLSALHQARALEKVLGIWPGRWLIPEAVKEEARAWVVERERITKVLDALCQSGVAAYTEIDPRTEGLLLPTLSRTLGQGEAVAIAIARGRGLGAALDDLAARRACERLSPPVPWIATEEILLCAVGQAYLARADALAIWKATGIVDPKRQLL